MKKRHFFLIILLSAGLMYAKSAHSQRLNYVPVENLDSLCSRFNEQVDGIYTGKLTELSMDTNMILKYKKRILNLIDTFEVKKDTLILIPLRTYVKNSFKYLTRLSNFSNINEVYIAPFQYNELKFLYTQMEISRNTLTSAISFSGMIVKMETTITKLGLLKSHLNRTFEIMQSNNDTNFCKVFISLDTIDRKVVKIDQTVRKNETKLKWALWITGATGVLSVAILILTLVH